MKVMIVDDEKPIRQWFEFILRDIEDMNIDIIGSYQNGKLALEACENEVPDVIFCDIIMPVMNGIELIKQVKEKYPQVEVLILSNFGDFDYVYQGLRFGAFDYLLKAKSDDEDIIRVMRQIQEKLEKNKAEEIDDFKENDYQHTVIKKIIKYIKENYNKIIKLSDIAKNFGYNADYLSQIFKKYTGKSFATYLTEIRINEAKKLMDSEENKIKDIALKVGYSNEMYFSTAFKKCTGVSPTEYKHSLKNKI